MGLGGNQMKWGDKFLQAICLNESLVLSFDFLIHDVEYAIVFFLGGRIFWIQIEVARHSAANEETHNSFCDDEDAIKS